MDRSERRRKRETRKGRNSLNNYEGTTSTRGVLVLQISTPGEAHAQRYSSYAWARASLVVGRCGLYSVLRALRAHRAAR